MAFSGRCRGGRSGRLTVVPRAGHFLFAEEPAAFAAVVREFLGSHRP